MSDDAVWLDEVPELVGSESYMADNPDKIAIILNRLIRLARRGIAAEALAEAVRPCISSTDRDGYTTGAIWAYPIRQALAAFDATGDD